MRIVFAVLSFAFLVLMIGSIASGQSIQLSIPASSGAIGSEISIPVNISDTTGRDIIAVEMTIQFDPLALGILDDEDPSTEWIDGAVDLSGTIADGWMTLVTEPVRGQVDIKMISGTPLSGSGVLAKVKFRALLTARVGSSYPISFVSALLNDGTPAVSTQGGSFTPEEGAEPARMPGDANGDDRVNHLDLLKLILSYGKNSGDAGYDSGADFDGDGHVDVDDAIVLWRNFGAVNQQ